MEWRNGTETTTEQNTKHPVKASRGAMIGERNTDSPLSGNDLPEAVTAPRESAKKPNDADGNGPAHTESVTARQRLRSGERQASKPANGESYGYGKTMPPLQIARYQAVANCCSVSGRISPLHRFSDAWKAATYDMFVKVCNVHIK